MTPMEAWGMIAAVAAAQKPTATDAARAARLLDAESRRDAETAPWPLHPANEIDRPGTDQDEARIAG
jgi:hypothetical protein